MNMSSTTVYFNEETNGLYSRHCARAKALRGRVTLFTGVDYSLRVGTVAGG